MKYENFLIKTKEFVILRITELVSLILILVSIAIFLALISYSPNDPNFIVNSSDIIKNFLGLRGSIVSDFLFQSVGLISYLIPFTFKSLITPFGTLERYFSSIQSSILIQITVENLFTYDGNHKQYDEINHNFTIINATFCGFSTNI